MVLVDTSVWIEVFRRSKPLDLATVAHLDDVVTCLPVVQEVLQGFSDEPAFRIAREAMLSLPIVESPLRVEVIEDAVPALPASVARRPHGPLGGGLPDRGVRTQEPPHGAPSRPGLRSAGHRVGSSGANGFVLTCCPLHHRDAATLGGP